MAKKRKSMSEREAVSRAREESEFAWIYEDLIDIDASKALAKRLVEDARMAQVWKAFAEYAATVAPWDWSLSLLIGDCLYFYDRYRVSVVRAPAAHRKHYGALADTLGSLRGSLREDIELHQIDKDACRVDPKWQGELLAIARTELVAFANSLGVAEPDPEDIARRALGLCSMLGARRPRLSAAIDRAAQEAQQIASRGPLSTRPSRATAPTTFFIRQLTQSLTQWTGRPWIDQVGVIATVAFNSRDEIEARDHLPRGNSSLKGRKKPH